MTITATDSMLAAPARTDPDFDGRVRDALCDAAEWGRLVADPALRGQTEQWLVDRIALIETQLARHQAEFTAYTATAYRRDFKVRLAEFQGWRARAINFKGMCTRRLTTLRRLEKQTAQDDAAGLVDALTDALQELSCAVLEYERGEIDAGELFRALDEITVPANCPPVLTAREHAVLYESACDPDPYDPTTEQQPEVPPAE